MNGTMLHIGLLILVELGLMGIKSTNVQESSSRTETSGRVRMEKWKNYIIIDWQSSPHDSVIA